MIEIKQDTSETKYMYFQNGCMEITETGRVFIPGEFTGPGVIPRFFEYDPGWKMGDFAVFLREASKDNEAFNLILKWYGYYLNNCPDYHGMALIITGPDCSGKTLIASALKHLIPSPELISLDGKGLDTRFPLVRQQTRIIILDDVLPKTINKLMHGVTNGIEVERKASAPFRINPKFLITSGKKIDLTGESMKARFTQISLTGYWNQKWTPEMVYGHDFFKSWDHWQWSSFDSMMVHACQLFLQRVG